MVGLGVAEQTQNAQALLVQAADGAQEGGLFIQGLAAVRAENRGDIQGLVLYEGIGGGVPGGVAPGLKGGPQAAGGEGGGIGLAPGQLLAGELHDDGVVAGGSDEAVMLFGGDTGHGLEPVGIVGGAQLGGPVLHGGGDLVGNGAGQGGAVGHALLPGFIGIGGQTLSHFVLIKDHAAEKFRDTLGGFVHCKLLSPRPRQFLYRFRVCGGNNLRE